MKDNISEYYVLEQIGKYAQSLSGADYDILSAENYLLAVVNILTGEPIPVHIMTSPLPKDIEKELSVICECYNISYLDTKEYLTPIIKEIADPVYDEYTMDGVLERANLIRQGYKRLYLSPTILLEAVLMYSTEHIKTCKYSEKKYLVENSLANEVYVELLEKSKDACNVRDRGVSVEKFLWTLCDVLENLSEDDLDTPIKSVRCAILEKCEAVFEEHKVSPKILKPLLADYIKNHKTELDDIRILTSYMLETNDIPAERHVQYKSADMLLECILKHHPDLRKGIFSVHDECYKMEQEAAKARRDEENDDSEYCFEEYHSDIIFEDHLEEITADEEEANDINKIFKSQLSNSIIFSRNLQNHLSSIVFGQDNAITTFASGYYQAKVRELTGVVTRKPYATFLFAGPPGVGKTFLAESIAQDLNLPFMRFDMSEYCDKEANFSFCGSNKVYKNSSRGNFTAFVADNPECVVLFDEVEKAHSVIINLFLQMLDAGVIKDNYTEQEVSLENAILIFTTNAGKQLYEDADSGDFSTISRKVIIKALQEDINPQTNAPFFPKAICSRFASGNVVMFNQITPHNLLNIAKREIECSASSFQEKSGINIEIDERVYAAILFAEGGNADARTIKNRANAIFNNELYEFFRHIVDVPCDDNLQNLENIKICVELPENQPEITELFEHQDNFKTLVFSSKHIVNSITRKTSVCDFLCARNIKEANDIMRKNDISMVLIDLNHGAGKDEDYLNISDEDSIARDYLMQLRQEDSSIPIYMLQTKKHSFNYEERIALANQGVRGIIDVRNPNIDVMMHEICENIHKQQCILSLAKANKVISFETAQKISDDSKNAEILLFDFKLKTAVDAEDSDNILNNVSKPDVKFDKVIGAEDAKEELAYFVEYLKNPKKYIGTGVKVPKGVLLYGPPGTGKTMLAKAMAGESDVTFICAEGNQFLKSTVGGGSQAIHDLFRTARKYAPAILFIDEIDAIAKERTGTGSAEDTLTALLTEMDGFKNQTAKPVFVLAATNFDIKPGGAKSLDPALMRRFDRRICVDLPNRSDRIKFMSMKIKSNSAFNISDELLDNLAVRSTGMSLADLESIFELGLRMAIRNKKTAVTDAVLEEAFETFNSGEKKEWNYDSLLRVARHESGHAIVCFENGETPSYITVVPRGDHGGYMQHNTDEGKHIFTKNELLAKIRTSLGGRAAEIVYYGKDDGISTGASADLLAATSLARQMVELYGMDDTVGLASFFNQGEMSQETRMAVNQILIDEMNNAIETIKANKKSIDKLSDALVNKNHLTTNEINKILQKNTL